SGTSSTRGVLGADLGAGALDRRLAARLERVAVDRGPRAQLGRHARGLGVDDELVARVERRVAAHLVDAHERGGREAEALGDLRERVAFAHAIAEADPAVLRFVVCEEL